MLSEPPRICWMLISSHRIRAPVDAGVVHAEECEVFTRSGSMVVSTGSMSEQRQLDGC